MEYKVLVYRLDKGRVTTSLTEKPEWQRPDGSIVAWAQEVTAIQIAKYIAHVFNVEPFAVTFLQQ